MVSNILRSNLHYLTLKSVIILRNWFTDLTARNGVHDLDTDSGVEQLRGELSRLDPATLFVSLGSGAEGQVMARIIQRTPRRTLAIAKGPDEARMRNVIREILPTVMFDIAMKPPR